MYLYIHTHAARQKLFYLDAPYEDATRPFVIFVLQLRNIANLRLGEYVQLRYGLQIRVNQYFMKLGGKYIICVCMWFILR